MNEREFQPYEMINDETLEPAAIANKILAYRDWYEKKEAKQKQVDALLEEAGHKPFFGRSGDDGINCCSPVESDAFKIFCAMVAGESALESRRDFDLAHLAKGAVIAAQTFKYVQSGAVVKGVEVMFCPPEYLKMLNPEDVEKMTVRQLDAEIGRLKKEHPDAY